MHKKFVLTKNNMACSGGIEDLVNRNPATPGLALVTGVTGAGKTTGLARAVATYGAAFLRADAVTTLSSLLDAICFAVGVDAAHSRNADKLNAIRAELVANPRPLFVDEADYLARDGRMLDTLRDIHDITGCAVVLVGMEGIPRQLTRHPQFARRIAQRIEFRPLDLDDARLVAKELCEVKVEEALVERMHRQTKGSIGLMVVALTQFETLAKGFGWKAITAAQWGERAMFLGDKGVS